MKNTKKKMCSQMSNVKCQMLPRRGFTLVELLLVIAIIGILTSVVMVSSQGSIEKSKRASAITTMSSMLPELVTCADDNGVAIAVATTTSTYACCKDTAAATSLLGCDTSAEAATGHLSKWPNIVTKTGYDYAGNPTGTIAAGTYVFFAKKTGQNRIICDYAANECCDDTSEAGTKTNCQ